MLDWMQAQIDQHGLLKVLWAPLAALLAIAGLAPFFANSLASGLVATLGVTACTALVLLVHQLGRNARLRQEQREMHRATSRLRTYVVERMPTQARNLLWRDFQGVGVKGDTFTRSEFQMLVEGDRPLRFVQIDQYGERLSDGEQRRMTLTAQREPDGTRLPLDWDWLNADALRYWIHFAIPIPPGEQIGFFYEFIWPHTLPNLALGEREVLEWEFVRPTDHFEVKLRLDPKLKRDRPLMATLHGMDQSKLRQFRDGDAWTLELGEDNLPQGHKIVLELDAGE